MQLHVHIPAHTQIDLGEEKNKHTDRFYLLHTGCLKQNVDF